jgi:hypothetical protein
MELEQREILFRGQCLDNKKWVYGGFIEYESGVNAIIKYDYKSLQPYRGIVDPETVTQYTGLKDSKGKKIFEGDIVKYEGEFWVWRWDPLNLGFTLARKKIKNPDWPVRKDGYIYMQLSPDIMRLLKVAGNIFENLELLKKND